MDTAIVSAGGTVQLIGLAVLLVIVIVMGAKVATGGSRGFSEVLVSVAAILVALYMIARPNDVITLMLRFVGGVQTPTLPH